MSDNGIAETLNQFDTSFTKPVGGMSDYLENQKILGWAKANAARDPEYIKHICERYRIQKNAERFMRANKIGRK